MLGQKPPISCLQQIAALEHSRVMYLFPHNEKWKSEFENEKASITSIYEGEIEIFHIGSTAIKGLYAKDCIDLLGVVKDISGKSIGSSLES
jgi:GrpB-like predicted nucleotidyltransferase (UPF0157 family)